MFGKLTLNSIPYDNPIIMGTLSVIVLIALTLIVWISRAKKWQYLWSEWFTSVDHKKIGFMYIFVILFMANAAFIRHRYISNKSYQQVNIPVLPIIKGLQKSRQHMMAYVIAFSIIAAALCLFGRTGYEYLIVATISCYMWCRVIFKNVDEENSVVWSKTVFKTSLLVVTGFSLVLGVELI